MDVTQNESTSVDSLLYCRACLSTHGRLFNIHEYKLADAFAHITGIYVDQDQLPQSLCVYCGTQLLKSASFRNMCLHTQQSLTLELVKEKHYMEDIHKINTSNPFLDLTLTEIQTIECIDIAPADTAIECIDIAPADTAIECIDIAPADTAIECMDTPATDTNMDCIDTTDIDLPLNDIDPEDINITLEPNLDFADVDHAMRRHNPNAKSTDSKYEYNNKTSIHNNILKTNVKYVVKKTDTKIADENLKQVLNANNDLRKPSVKLNQIDGTIEITDTKMKDAKKKLNIKKRS
ncbi:uncharacterized protein LOC133532842 [Cydia pomonella]|uniref:uncharacterized protein LOC133532842 n=1 Tax=Cydia pomonella TaxID=82600 RepID=UPI002ADDCA05|nr:uncharacterized protein LOC133532842 [Cydia pomonella]